MRRSHQVSYRHLVREKTHGEVVDRTCEAAEPLSVFSGQNHPGGLRDYQLGGGFLALFKG